jgi:hypothetical protein
MLTPEKNRRKTTVKEQSAQPTPLGSDEPYPAAMLFGEEEQAVRASLVRVF